MAAQAQEYFFKLLLSRELVREALSDVYEATVFEKDDQDISDGMDWKISETAKWLIGRYYRASSTIWDFWKIGPDDMYSLSHLLFWIEISGQKWLYDRIEAANLNSSGIVFQILSRFVEKNIWISDEIFTVFRASQSKEDMELILSTEITYIFQSLEKSIREHLSSYRSILEILQRKADFLDENEIRELQKNLEDFTMNLVRDLEQIPKITDLEGKFENFWGNIAR